MSGIVVQNKLRSFETRLADYMKAAFPALAIQTCEEQRAISDIIHAAKACGKQTATWSATEGLMVLAEGARKLEDSEDLEQAVRAARFKDTVYILRDVQTWPVDRQPVLARAIRDMLAWCPTEGSIVIFLGPEFRPHPTFEKLVTVLDFALPDEAYLRHIVVSIQESAGWAEKTQKPEEVLPELVRALSGLSVAEAENALSLSIVETDAMITDIVYREKVQAVKRSGLLEIIEPDPRGLGAIGGLEVLKDWILKRRQAYTPEAEHFGLPSPKGLMIVGVPGTGKSLSARAIGTALGVPTVKLDIGALFGSLVGESETRTRDALKLAEAMSPCVLWVDEIDKGLAGSGGSGSSDSGVTRRVFGTVISWMQERKRPVFLVATANQVEGLPPELLRKGRFDEIFAIDLPTPDERRAIVEIQLKARDRWRLVKGKPTVDTAEVAAATVDFTGSEIEGLINEAMFEVFARDGAKGEVKTADLVAAAATVVPLAKMAKEQIESIRRWAQNRARFASGHVRPVSDGRPAPLETTEQRTVKRRISKGD